MRKSFPHRAARAFGQPSPGEDIMNDTSILAARGQTDQVVLARALDQLVRDEIARSVSVDAMITMHEGGIAGLASLANASSVAEGRLLEKVIALIAESNPNLSVFAQVRLPVREDALELVEKNPEALYRGLTLDANARTRKSYIADLIILNRVTRLGHVIDIKRSLGSYEAARILELRQRMLAAALVAPDLLWKDHQRMAVDEVRVVILEAAGKRTDVRNGIWNLGHLDHLLEVPGAADLVRRVRQDFERLTEQNLLEARDQLRKREVVSFDAEKVKSRALSAAAVRFDPASGFSSSPCAADADRGLKIGMAPPPPPMAH
jgi:hypothetical protein